MLSNQGISQSNSSLRYLRSRLKLLKDRQSAIQLPASKNDGKALYPEVQDFAEYFTEKYYQQMIQTHFSQIHLQVSVYPQRLAEIAQQAAEHDKHLHGLEIELEGNEENDTGMKHLLIEQQKYTEELNQVARLLIEILHATAEKCYQKYKLDEAKRKLFQTLFSEMAEIHFSTVLHEKMIPETLSFKKLAEKSFDDLAGIITKISHTDQGANYYLQQAYQERQAILIGNKKFNDYIKSERVVLVAGTFVNTYADVLKITPLVTQLKNGVDNFPQLLKQYMQSQKKHWQKNIKEMHDSIVDTEKLLNELDKQILMHPVNYMNHRQTAIDKMMDSKSLFDKINDNGQLIASALKKATETLQMLSLLDQEMNALSQVNEPLNSNILQKSLAAANQKQVIACALLKTLDHHLKSAERLLQATQADLSTMEQQFGKSHKWTELTHSIEKLSSAKRELAVGPQHNPEIKHQGEKRIGIEESANYIVNQIGRKKQLLELKFKEVQQHESREKYDLAQQVIATISNAITKNIDFWVDKVKPFGSGSSIEGRPVPGGVAESYAVIFANKQPDPLFLLAQLKKVVADRQIILLSHWKYKFGIRKPATTGFYDLIHGIDMDKLTVDTVNNLQRELARLGLKQLERPLNLELQPIVASLGQVR